MSLELRNPHAVLAAIDARPHDVLQVRLTSSHPSPAWQRVATEAARNQIPVIQARSESPRPRQGGGGRRDSGKRDSGGRTSGTLAVVKEKPSTTLEHLFAGVDESDRGVWLALDCLQDPHNVGAILRSASFFGVRGVLVTRDRSCPLNSTVYDIATGGIEYLQYCSVGNLSQALKIAKNAGLWMLGATEHADVAVQQIERDRPWLLIVGNEEKGLRRLTLSKCDQTCAIPSMGGVTSLNASVATGCLLALLTSG